MAAFSNSLVHSSSGNLFPIFCLLICFIMPVWLLRNCRKSKRRLEYCTDRIECCDIPIIGNKTEHSVIVCDLGVVSVLFLFSYLSFKIVSV